MRVIKGEGMPQHKRPFEKGNLYVKFNVKFPVPNELNDKQLEQLEKILPPRRTPPKVTEETEQVELQTVSTNEKEQAQRQQQYQRQQREAYESDDEESQQHRGPGGVQCAQQ
jgi:DnaJ family protein A protein 2